MGELFNIEKMKKSISKAKRRSTWKTVLISMIVIVVVLFSSILANGFITPLLASPVQNAFYQYNQVKGANEFIGVEEFYPGILGGENYYKKYKQVGDRIIYSGEGGYGYGLFRDEVLGRIGSRSTGFTVQMDKKPSYNELGQRMMTFFYPQLNYDVVNNDLLLLNEIANDKLVEMALSFDKGYTSSEAMALIPKDITKTWLWVNHIEQGGKLYSINYDENQNPLGKLPLTLNGQDAYGFSVINTDGTFADQPAERFISAIDSGAKFNSYWQQEFQNLKENIAGEDDKLSVNDLVINGIVVTGTAESLKQLQNLPFIKASSLGVVIDKY
ncbi:anti sigma factor C-terminal domain-containing protein [Solibacillus merdavium]|uniref:Anti sigma factor C-terminal domain-containing protein n=1 Tax=Solibacillus merdavium TaxID=2762218 RepID=A0ABR8XQV7_9BACL|nr:anti sigma factor C-terminal domain-containing protein [Solibacillus merdavium]MBD8034324.1 anti sigma factor C-terminal domain-containing protein [Solibacillus merdavium]